MPKILAFDIWGRYAHFKKIFATTSALSYVIPSKTAIYGLIGAIIGLDKFDNKYLDSFIPGNCIVGIQIINPIVMQRINTNLHPHTHGLIKSTQNRKPTTVEYVYRPRYRIYFSHSDNNIYSELKKHLQNHTSVYTPSLGLANLIADFEYLGESDLNAHKGGKDKSIVINSVIPSGQFLDFDLDSSISNEIIEYSQFSVEMNSEREVTKREDVLLDRKGNPIKAFIKNYHTFKVDNFENHVILF